MCLLLCCLCICVRLLCILLYSVFLFISRISEEYVCATSRRMSHMFMCTAHMLMCRIGHCMSISSHVMLMTSVGMCVVITCVFMFRIIGFVLCVT